MDKFQLQQKIELPVYIVQQIITLLEQADKEKPCGDHIGTLGWGNPVYFDMAVHLRYTLASSKLRKVQMK